MIIKDRELTDIEVQYNNNKLQNLTLRDIMLSDSIINLYNRLGLYIAIDNNYNWSIKNSNLTVDTDFLDKHYKNISNLKNDSYLYAIKKLIQLEAINKYSHITECKKEIKDQFNKLYLKYFNFLITRYQKLINVNDNNLCFLTNDYRHIT